MKLSKLLSQREALLEHARLANLAFAYAKLADISTRVDRAQLRGAVTLRHPQPDTERYTATLTMLEGNQSVIEEHFTDEDVLDLADVIAFLYHQRELELTFRIEELADKFMSPLRLELEQIGVELSPDQPLGHPTEEGSPGAGCPQFDGRD
jgi:hypothetical protein